MSGRSLLALASLSLVSCVSEVISGGGGSGSFAVGTASHQVGVAGLNRSYVLHVPTKRPVRTGGTVRPYSLVIVLHGSSGSAEEIRATTRMDSLSEVYRFLVAYPNGVKGAGGLYPSDWNAGTCCGASARENIDDVGFITALIAQVSTELSVDPKRVTVVGFSDGGRMAYRVACQLSPLIAAVAVVSGSLRDDQCVPAKPVPLIAIHGTSDGEVPYDEPSDTPLAQPVAGVGAVLPPAVQFWIARNGCTGGVVVRRSTNVLRTDYASCTNGQVTFYKITGGAHGWPGDPGGVGSQPPMSELNASAVIAAFIDAKLRT